MGNHVFICYAREDQDFVLRLASELKAREIPIWLDQWDLLPGENYIESIDVVIDSCEKLLLVLSPDSASSREVRGEWLSALAKNKPIVPVLARACNVPRQLLDLHRIDFTNRGPNDESALAPLVRALGRTSAPAGKENSDKILFSSPQPQEPVKPPEPPRLPPREDKARKLSVRNIGIVLGLVVLAIMIFSPSQEKKSLDPSPSLQLGTTPEKSSSPEKKDANDKEGMVPVPAGDFWMGCNEKVDQECDNDEKPGKTVSLAAFQIDKTEVTVVAYRRCVEAGKCKNDGLTMPYWDGKEQPDWAWACNWGKTGKDDYPINCVDWNQADAYCRWAGKRLPTEAEWEKAARGTDGWKYAWGNTGFVQAGKVANIADETAKKQQPTWEIAEGYDDGYYGTAPVGSFPAGESPFHAFDMIGNVWEWTADWYAEDYYKNGSTQNPKGAENGQYRSVRGGSWGDRPRHARASNRGRCDPGGRDEYVGCRCAQ